MNTNARFRIGAVVVIVAGAAWACSSDAVEDLGDAMVDAGGLLRDAASDDASAQVAIDAECTIERTHTQRYESGTTWSENTLTYWYAEVAAPDATEGAAEVGGTACGLERFGSPSACPAGLTCTGDSPLDQMDCGPAAVQFEAGRVRVYCGFRLTQATNTTATPSVSGQRYQRVRVYVRR